MTSPASRRHHDFSAPHIPSNDTLKLSFRRLAFAATASSPNASWRSGVHLGDGVSADGNLIDTDLYRHLGNEGNRDMEDWFSGGGSRREGRTLLATRSGPFYFLCLAAAAGSLYCIAGRRRRHLIAIDHFSWAKRRRLFLPSSIDRANKTYGVHVGAMSHVRVDDDVLCCAALKRGQGGQAMTWTDHLPPGTRDVHRQQ